MAKPIDYAAVYGYIAKIQEMEQEAEKTKPVEFSNQNSDRPANHSGLCSNS